MTTGGGLVIRNNLQRTKATAQARALRTFKHREPMQNPPLNELWLCQVCESTFGQGDSIGKIVTCDGCALSIEAERTFIVSGR